MSKDFDKLPDVVTYEWLDKFYHDHYRGHLSKLNSFQAMDCLAIMTNEARAADRQEITGLRKDVHDLVEKLNETKALWNRDHAKLATYEEREKRGAMEFDEWCDKYGFDNEQNNYYRKQGWRDARIGWEPKRDPNKWLCVEWPEGSLDVQLQFYGKGDLEKLDHIIRPVPQPTPAQLRAEMLAKLDAEYQRIEAEMSRIEAMTDAEVLAQKDYHAD